MNLIFPILMAMTAYASLSIGFILMKKGIACFGWKGKKDKTFYSNLVTWISGFIIANIYGVPSALALKILPPHIVSAFAGFGIVVLIFLSHILLKEKIFKTDYGFSFLIIIGIVFLNIVKNPGFHSSSSTFGIIILFGIPLILFLSGFSDKFTETVKTVIYSSVSGFSAGLMVMFLGILVQKFQYQIGSYLGSIFLYLYLFSALLSMVSLQFANKYGPMMLIGPVQYSTTIVYPVIGSLLIFNYSIHLVQYFSIAVVILAVIFIMKKR